MGSPVALLAQPREYVLTRTTPVARDQLHEQQQQHLDPTVAPDVVRRETVPGVPGVPGGRRAPAHFSESRRAWTEPVPTHIIDMAKPDRTHSHPSPNVVY